MADSVAPDETKQSGIGVGIAVAATVLYVASVVGAAVWVKSTSDWDATKLNEIGDWLAGTLLPVAIAWAIAAFFLQRTELRLQRQESVLQRIQAGESLKAYEEQAQQQAALAAATKAANLIADRGFWFENRDMWERRLTALAGDVLRAAALPLRQHQQGSVGPVLDLIAAASEPIGQDGQGFHAMAELQEFKALKREVDAYVLAMANAGLSLHVTFVFSDIAGWSTD